MKGVLLVSSHRPVSCTDAQTSAQTPYSRCSARKDLTEKSTGESCQFETKIYDDSTQKTKPFQEHMHTSAVLLLLYLIEYVRITSVEQVRQSLLYPSDHLWPH